MKSSTYDLTRDFYLNRNIFPDVFYEKITILNPISTASLPINVNTIHIVFLRCVLELPVKFSIDFFESAEFEPEHLLFRYKSINNEILVLPNISYTDFGARKQLHVRINTELVPNELHLKLKFFPKIEK